MATQELLKVTLLDKFNPFIGLQSLEQDGGQNSVGVSRPFLVQGIGLGRIKLIVPKLEEIRHNLNINNFDFHGPDPTMPPIAEVPSITEVLRGFVLAPQVGIKSNVNLSESTLVFTAYIPHPEKPSSNCLAISAGELHNDIVTFHQFTDVATGYNSGLLINISPEDPEFAQKSLGFLQKCDFRLDLRSGRL